MKRTPPAREKRKEWAVASSKRSPELLRSKPMRYLYSQSGCIVGYMDQRGTQLCDEAGSVIAKLDPTRIYMYRLDGSAYAYVSGVGKKYLFAPSGEIIGYFKPGFLELV